MAEAGHAETPTVCIGGINESNLQRTRLQSEYPGKGLTGVAVVSAIMAAQDPEGAARRLLVLSANPAGFEFDMYWGEAARATGLPESISQVPNIIKMVHDTTPLSHNMTNLVCVLDSSTDARRAMSC